MTMMSHTVSGRVRYGGFGFGFGFGFGVRYSEVRWVGMGLGGQLIGYLRGKLNAYRSQCKVKGACPVRAQRVCLLPLTPLDLTSAPVRV